MSTASASSMRTPFRVKGWKELEALAPPEFSRNRLDSCRRLITVLDGEIEHADFELLAAFAGDDRVARLRAIPGIAFLTAVTVLAEVGDISRFGSAAQLCSWAGLTPREHSSAQHIKRGHISRQGSPWLRWILVESAATNKACKGEQLRDFHQRIAKRRGKMSVPGLRTRTSRPYAKILQEHRGQRDRPAPGID